MEICISCAAHGQKLSHHQFYTKIALGSVQTETYWRPGVIWALINYISHFFISRKETHADVHQATILLGISESSESSGVGYISIAYLSP